MAIYPVYQVVQPRNLPQMATNVHLLPLFYRLKFLPMPKSIVKHHALIHRVRNRRNQVSAEAISQSLLPRRIILCFILSQIGVTGRTLGIGDEGADFWGCSRSWGRYFVSLCWPCGQGFGGGMVRLEELKRVGDNDVGLLLIRRRALAGGGRFEPFIIRERYFQWIDFLAQVSHARLYLNFNSNQ